MSAVPQGERIARLEEAVNNIKDDVAGIKQDVAAVDAKVAALDVKLDTRESNSAAQFQDLKNILLAQNVARQTRIAIGGKATSYGGWIITQIVVIAAAILGSNAFHSHH
jgi:hypothetical protein